MVKLKHKTNKLDKRSIYLRELIVSGLEGGKRGHVGSSMSLVEILRVFYLKPQTSNLKPLLLLVP